MPSIAIFYPRTQRSFAEQVRRGLHDELDDVLTGIFEIDQSVHDNVEYPSDWTIVAIDHPTPDLQELPRIVKLISNSQGMTIVARDDVEVVYKDVILVPSEGLDAVKHIMPRISRYIQAALNARGQIKDDKDDVAWAITNGTLIRNSEGGVEFNTILFRRIDEFEWSVRTDNCLRNDNIIFIGDLVRHTEGQMLRIPNFGRKSLNEVKEVLSSINLRLGLDIPGWPPENIEEEIARSKLADQISRLQQEPFGATFEIANDRIRIDSSGTLSDVTASESPIVEQLHQDILGKLQRLNGVAPRLDNQIGWAGINSLSNRLLEFASRPISSIPNVIGSLYGATLELASFLEMDAAVTRGASTFAVALDPEIRRPMEDVLRTLAPWLRSFPSIRELDDEMGRFLLKDPHVSSSIATIDRAREAELIDEADADSVSGLLSAETRGDGQGQKAGRRGYLSVTNLLVVAAGVTGTIISGAVGSDLATKSTLVKRAGDFIVSAEPYIVDMLEGMPNDVRLALELLFRELDTSPAVISQRPRIGSDSVSKIT